jgi:hypothetical protein
MFGGIQSSGRRRESDNRFSAPRVSASQAITGASAELDGRSPLLDCAFLYKLTVAEMDLTATVCAASSAAAACKPLRHHLIAVSAASSSGKSLIAPLAALSAAVSAVERATEAASEAAGAAAAGFAAEMAAFPSVPSLMPVARARSDAEFRAHSSSGKAPNVVQPGHRCRRRRQYSPPPEFAAVRAGGRNFEEPRQPCGDEADPTRQPCDVHASHPVEHASPEQHYEDRQTYHQRDQITPQRYQAMEHAPPPNHLPRSVGEASEEAGGLPPHTNVLADTLRRPELWAEDVGGDGQEPPPDHAQNQPVPKVDRLLRARMESKLLQKLVERGRTKEKMSSLAPRVTPARRSHRESLPGLRPLEPAPRGVAGAATLEGDDDGDDLVGYRSAEIDAGAAEPARHAELESDAFELGRRDGAEDSRVRASASASTDAAGTAPGRFPYKARAAKVRAQSCLAPRKRRRTDSDSEDDERDGDFVETSDEEEDEDDDEDEGEEGDEYQEDGEDEQPEDTAAGVKHPLVLQHGTVATAICAVPTSMKGTELVAGMTVRASVLFEYMNKLANDVYEEMLDAVLALQTSQYWSLRCHRHGRPPAASSKGANRTKGKSKKCNCEWRLCMRVVNEEETLTAKKRAPAEEERDAQIAVAVLRINSFHPNHTGHDAEPFLRGPGIDAGRHKKKHRIPHPITARGRRN